MTGLADLSASVRRWLKENPEAVAKFLLWMDEASEGEGRPLADQILPSNWRRLSVGLIGQLLPFMEETGLCLVWVPRAEVIEAIFDAPSEEREDTLLTRAQEILADVDSTVAEVNRPELAYLQQFVAEAADAFRAGVETASQALSAVVISSVVEDHYGFERLSDARKSFEVESPQSAGMWSSRRIWVQVAVHRAILRSDQMPASGGFNRNATAHGTEWRQYTPANALAALMLAAGSLRELQEMYRVGERGFSPSTGGGVGKAAATARPRGRK